MTSIPSQTNDIAPPPEIRIGPVAWVRKNLFSTWYNGLLTIIIGGIFFQTVKSVFIWATQIAQWEIIPANWPLYYVGLFPKDQYWRIWIVLGAIALLSGLSWGVLARQLPKLFTKIVLIGIGISCAALMLVPFKTEDPRPLLLGMVGLLVGSAWGGKQAANRISTLGRWISFAWFLSFFLVLWLLAGGLGIEEVSTSKWGGLTLTILMAVTSIAACFPIGVLLALGRQSSLPVMRWFCIVYIEFIRGIPLISILFLGQVMVPLFLPEGIRPDRVLRAIVGLTMFSSAYLAENVRGGLQSIPRGQVEAARALGLNTPLVLALIVLPQALKAVIPAIVGQFISLFQDTTLLAIVGLAELLGISNSILANPKFLGRYAEVYLFIGIIYWFLCYIMSVGSRRLEKTLNVERR